MAVPMVLVMARHMVLVMVRPTNMIMAVIMTLIMIVGDPGLVPVDPGSVVEVAGAVQGHILLIQVTPVTTIAVDDNITVAIHGRVLGHQAFVLIRPPHPAELILMVQRIVVMLPRVVQVLVIHLMAVCLYPTIHLLEPIILRLTNTTPVSIHPNLAHAAENIYQFADLLHVTHAAQIIYPAILADLLHIAHVAQIIYPALLADPLTPIPLIHPP